MQVDSSNVAQLAVPQTRPLERRDHIQGPDAEAEFLSLRLLNKRGRVRLSPESIDYSRLPGKSSLFAVGNTKGWFAAAIRKEDMSHHILVSTLGDLRTAYESGQPDPEPFIPFTPRRSPFRVPGTPTILKFALNDERLIVGFLEGPILVYNTDALFSSSEDPQPIFTIPGDASTIPRDILPNPEDSPELVAIMRGVHGQEPGHQVDIVDVQAFRIVAGWRKGSDPNVTPVSISWSPKGKQIAIGLQSGDMLMFSPSSTGSPKSHLSKPSSTPPDASSLLSTTWLSNPTFYTVFSTPEASSTLFDPTTSDSPVHMHFISTHDSKSASAVDVELRDPCPPFGVRRPPGQLTAVLRTWSPTKFIIFCGDGASSDIGVIGALPSDDPSKPGDQWVSFNLEETSTPSLPLDEELNDLTLLGLEVDLTSSTSIRMSQQSGDDAPDLPPSPILYAYTNDGTVVAWHILNGTGAPYPGMTGAVSRNAVLTVQTIQRENMKPHENSPAISPVLPQQPIPDRTVVASATSAFGTSPASSSSTMVAPARGFGAFGGNSTSTTGFGFGGGSTSPKFGQASTAPVFSSTSFTTNMQDEVSTSTPSPAFGTTGFGASPVSQAVQQKPAPSATFGKTGFGLASAAPTFGSSGFGVKPAVPAFGQSGFGISSVRTTAPSSSFGSISGGFASFANQGSSAFVPPADSKAISTASSASSPAFGQGSFGQTSKLSAFGSGGQGQAKPPASVFGSGGVGEAEKASASTFVTSASFDKTGASAVSGKSAFESSSTLAPRESSGLTGFGALGDALKPSLSSARFDTPPGSPTSPASSLPGSPELRPTSAPEKPVSSYLRPAEGFGSFNAPSQGFGSFEGAPNIKPAEGFSAGSLPKASPVAFSRQKETVPSATPVFGSTSALGQAKPVFGTTSLGTSPQPAVVEPSKPITGGFSAFSAGKGGFASFADAGKSASFADILRSGEPDKPKVDATPLVFGSTSPSKPRHSPALGVLNEPKVSSRAPADAISTQEVESGSRDRDVSGERGNKLVASQEPLLKEDDSSFSLLSLGDAVSRVKSSSTPKPDAFSKKAEIEPVGEKEEAGNDDDEEKDETGSEPFSLTDDGLEEAVSEEGEDLPHSQDSLSEDEEADHLSSPTTSRDGDIPPSASVPHQEPTNREVEVPEIKALSPPPESVHLPSSADEASTTPPGSPQRLVTANKVSLPTIVTPTPVIAVSPTPLVGLGVGRPSSRPIRSSPLASTPITSADDEESEPETSPLKSTPPTAIGKPGESNTRKTHPSVMATSSPSTTIPEEGPASSKPRRQKTPPLPGAPSSFPSVTPPQLPDSSSLSGQPQTSLAELKKPSLPAQPQIVTNVASPTSHQVAVDDEQTPKHPMQVEFLRAYQEMTKGLVQFYQNAQEMELIRPIISEPRGLDKFIANNQDFVPGQYSHGDLKAFTKIIGILQNQVVSLLELGNTNKRSLRDLQNLALMSDAKQEEVIRWVHARQDPEFANTLKPRTLSPEHSENQFRLRKAVQVARDRIQQCEDEIESLKRRLERYKSGKVGLRPPSLDTIDRTCRNIQLALEDRTRLLERLQDRIETLSPKASQRLRTATHTRSPVSSPRSVTPPFASIAAAALNSERLSLRLKATLLSERREPLLTTKVAKLESLTVAGTNTWLSPQQQWLESKLLPVPSLNSPIGSTSSLSRRTGRTGKRHGAVQLKERTPESSAKTVAFDWGPLPGAAPMDKLSSDVRSSRERDSP